MADRNREPGVTKTPLAGVKGRGGRPRHVSLKPWVMRVIEINRLHADGMSIAALACQFKVTRRTVERWRQKFRENSAECSAALVNPEGPAEQNRHESVEDILDYLTGN
jgi:Helix-turn-helix domain